MARVEDEWGVGLERVWEQVTARLLEENKGNKMKRDLCQMHFGKMKEALFSSLEESLDMKTGEPKGWFLIDFLGWLFCFVLFCFVLFCFVLFCFVLFWLLVELLVDFD